MGMQARYGSLAIGAFWASMGATIYNMLQDDNRWDARNRDYGRRALKTVNDKVGWSSRWPRPSFGGAGAFDYCLQNQEYGSGFQFEPFSCAEYGSPQNRFIKGICKDASSAVVANATVQAFRTSDDLYVGEGVSRNDGSYDCPVATVSGVNHYLVAYKSGSPDITGATVNTLTSTLVDGT